MKNIYAVIMRKYGLKETHSYIFGVTTKKYQAYKMAEQEEKSRGGKYSSEIIELELNKTIDEYEKVIKSCVRPEWYENK